MVFRLQTSLWRRNPAVPIDEYGRLLRDALIGLGEYRSHAEIIDGVVPLNEDPTALEIRLIIGQMQDQFEAFQNLVGELEKIRPEPKELMEPHVRAIGFFRGHLVYTDRINAALVMTTQGKDREASKLDKEAAECLQTYYYVRKKFLMEHHRIRTEHPELTKALALPAKVLHQLSLRQTRPVLYNFTSPPRYHLVNPTARGGDDL